MLDNILKYKAMHNKVTTVATLIATSFAHAHVSLITCISPLISSGPILIVTFGSGLELYHH